MSRDARVWVTDILEGCRRVAEYTVGMNIDAFRADQRTLDAVVRNLQIVGEAAKHLSDDVRALEPGIEWRKIPRRRRAANAQSTHGALAVRAHACGMTHVTSQRTDARARPSACAVRALERQCESGRPERLLPKRSRSVRRRHSGRTRGNTA